jgi:spore coat protein H
MKSWIRSGIITMLFLLVLLVIIFVFYRGYLYDLLFEEYTLFDDEFVYEKVETYTLNFDHNTFINQPIDTSHNIYLTVLEMNNLSFTEYINQSDGKSSKTYDVYFYDDKKSLFDNGFFVRQANSELKLKGKNPFNDRQKSFKLTLFDSEGLWENQKTINFEKQEADPLRIRNKLALDLQEDIDHLFSLKSSFVRLFIKDLNMDPDTFYDYGLFVQVENMDDLYFLNREMSPEGYLYEMDNFRFQEASLGRLEKDNDVNTKGDKSNKKFNDFISAVHTPDIPTKLLVEQYFEKDHLLNWLAFNILIGNKNVVERDYYLYSPKTSNKWYFIPDDSDASFGRIKNAPNWKLGIGNYYNNALYSRILLDETLRNDLINRVETMGEELSASVVKEKLDIYYDEFFTSITNEPDFAMLEYSFEDFRLNYYELMNYPEKMIINFKESLNFPLPFKVSIDLNEDDLVLSNFNSQMLDGSDVEYLVTLSHDKSQKDIVKQFSTMEDFLIIENLDPGIFYVNVSAWHENGYTQDMSNMYEDEFGKKKNGLIRVEIN